MGSHHNHNFNLEEKYIFSSEVKRKLIIVFCSGLASAILGIIIFSLQGESHHEGAKEVAGASHHAYHWMQRVWAVLWMNNVYFTGISLIGLFWVAVQYVSYSGWSTPFKRVPEAMGAFLPYTGVLMLVYFIFAQHDLFHWTHHELFEKTLENGAPNPEYDSIIANKAGYLNLPFFYCRMVVFFGLWILMWNLLRKKSLQEDLEGGVIIYDKSIVLGAVTIIIYAVSSSMAAWDWVMSIDTHWFSTMFGWYVHASWWVSGIATITLIIILLKENGYLHLVNENHLHDLGKFIFGFSIFWTYIWTSQFLLIFYANISEETTYFIDRLYRFDNHYTPIFAINLIVNFVLPFLGLMSRDFKRQMFILKVICIMILVGHWVDFYMMVMPGTIKENSGFGFLEIGVILMYVSGFAYVVAKTLSKANLVAKKHPLLEEGLHHNI